MKSPYTAQEEHRFGEFRLDLRQGLLFRGTEEVKLRPKAFEALRVLATSNGKLVTKGELIEALWPGATAVSEDSIAHCVMEVRKALGDGGQSILRTVTGRGYLFHAGETPPAEVLSEEIAETPARPRWIWNSLIALGACGVLAGFGFFGWRERQIANWTAAVEAAVANEDYRAAFDSAQRVLALRPDENRVLRLLNDYSDDLTVTSEPAGAEVYLQALGETLERKVGTTPIERMRIPHVDAVLRLRRAGYADFERTISTSIQRSHPSNRSPWDLKVHWRMLDVSQSKPGMIYVPQTKHYQIRMLRALAPKPVTLEPYYIDRFEVSNADFQNFVDARGFEKISLGKDQSGLPGPRGWNAGRAPEGLSKHPVTGVTWLEARGYCQSLGKDLPTIYQWQAATREPGYTPYGLIYPWGLFRASDVASRGNLRGSGTWSVGSQPFGMSRVGAYDLAGNVREWLLNERSPGRAIAGGSWRDDVYQFLVHGSAEETKAADDLGFRCALGADAEGSGKIENAPAEPYPAPLSENEFDEVRRVYAYTNESPGGKILSAQEGPGWRREELQFPGANGEMASGYLYLPKGVSPPYQAIQFLGGMGYFLGVPLTEIVEGRQLKMEPFIKAGRALFLVRLIGFEGRPPVGQYASLFTGPRSQREITRQWIEDLRRGLDYLGTRPDIDAKRVVFWNNSTAEIGSIAAAVEARYAAVIFGGAGLEDWSLSLPKDLNPALAAPFIEAPKLVMHGAYDEQHPVNTMGRTFFDSLRGYKKWVQFDGGHIAPPEVALPAVLPWLDANLGKVRANTQ
jgi:formylglycine-generating enzyme required for sulfatase activity/DNA-binding winged helix-turn-helix (wHTH) protein